MSTTGHHSIETEIIDADTAVIRFQGYLGEEAGEELMRVSEPLLRGGHVRLALGITHCPAIASPGVAWLIELMERVTGDFSGDLVFFGLDKSQVELLTFMEVLTQVPHAPSETDALDLLRS